MSISISFNGITEISTPKADRKKGKSLIDFPHEYTVIDIETTGLDPYFDYIIEVSAIKYENNIIIDSYSSLLKPDEYPYYDDDEENPDLEFGYYVDDFITSLTGITNQMIEEAPPSKEVLETFFKFIGDSILVGHNVNFDINFLYDNRIKYFNCPLKNDFVDTLRLARLILKDLPHHRLKDLILHYNINVEQEHRAFDDCKATNEIFKLLASDAKNQFGSIDSFIESRKSSIYGIKAKDINKTSDNIDPDCPLYNKTCVFTGKLDKMARKDAMQLVVNIGGLVADNVTKKTNYLILGNNDYCSTIKNGKSSKQKKAENLKLSGQDIEIITENVFYDMLSY